MSTALRSKAISAAVIVVVGLVAIHLLGNAGAMTRSSTVERPALVEIGPGSFAYRMAGDFIQARRPVAAPLVQYRLEGALEVMRHQVTIAEYKRCVAAGACKTLATSVNQGPDFPAVQVSWEDATAYAAWLSAATDETYRLPTDEEWVYAAGSRFKDDGLEPARDPNNPSEEWLAKYDLEAAEEGRTDSRTRTVGSFGENEHGVADMSGNVWEWTNTCFARQSLDAAGRPAGLPVMNCGVRLVEGQHRAHVPNFIRDARAGGCAVGKPPSNLGFRLIRVRG